MQPIVAVIAPGMMGSGVGHRLAENGIEVRTSLGGRSEATVARAKAAGMVGVSDEQIAASDIILSILPPGDALGLAERLAPALRAAANKPMYVDCNALDPATVLRIARVVQETGTPFVDGGIIGGPPKPGSQHRASTCRAKARPVWRNSRKYGLEMPIQPGPIGAASAMKMSYAGITKGFTALGAAMMLAASRAGTAEDLRAELSASQPALFGWLTRQMPNMYSKAYRWVAEMEEIAQFVGEDPAARKFYEGAAQLYERIAADYDGDRKEIAALDAFCKPKANAMPRHPSLPADGAGDLRHAARRGAGAGDRAYRRQRGLRAGQRHAGAADRRDRPRPRRARQQAGRGVLENWRPHAAHRRGGGGECGARGAGRRAADRRRRLGHRRGEDGRLVPRQRRHRSGAARRLPRHHPRRWAHRAAAGASRRRCARSRCRPLCRLASSTRRRLHRYGAAGEGKLPATR